VLLADGSAEQLVARLRDPRHRAEAEAHLETFHLRLPDLGGRSLGDLVGPDRDRLESLIRDVARGHADALRGLAERYPGRALSELSEQPPDDLGQRLREQGFSVRDADVRGLRDYAEGLRARARLRQALLDSNVRAAVARTLSLDVSEISLDGVAAAIRSAERAAWLSSVLSDARYALGVSPDRLHALLGEWARQRRLMQVVGAGAPAEQSAGWWGLDARARWLLLLSLIVCVVGVANALLMSVTERFAEIATMKCLGAMDRFVMMMFVFEAALQGLLGGVIGVGLGLMLSLLRGVVDYGELLAVGAAKGPLALAGLTSLAVGIALACLAAVGPAFIASRLAPMEAMRVE
jgi:putative ABC transport system permease protein